MPMGNALSQSRCRSLSKDDPDVNVVDMDDGIEHEDDRSQRQNNNESNSTADQRYSDEHAADSL